MRSSSGCGTKGELRAILVKVGGLLAPNHFQVAIGDRPVDPPEQHSQSEVNSAGEREGVPGEGCEGVPGEGVSGDDGDDGDDGNSEATSVMRGEEVEGEGEGEGERDKTKDRERLYEVLKQQVQAHKEEMGETNGTDRSTSHCWTYWYTVCPSFSGVGSGLTWPSLLASARFGMSPSLLPSSASYSTTTDGQV